MIEMTEEELKRRMQTFMGKVKEIVRCNSEERAQLKIRGLIEEEGGFLGQLQNQYKQILVGSCGEVRDHSLYRWFLLNYRFDIDSIYQKYHSACDRRAKTQVQNELDGTTCTQKMGGVHPETCQ